MALSNLQWPRSAGRDVEQGLGSRLQLLAHSRPPVSEVRWGGLGSLWD